MSIINSKNPTVAILMGSKSDLPKLQPTIEILKDFEINHTVHVMSAHRTPQKVAEFVTDARINGYLVIIAAAGLAAHLAGVVAAHTTLPVIGIPIDGGPFRGVDALLSTVQMPSGTPVATVATGSSGCKNAAYLTLRILSLLDTKLTKKLIDFNHYQSYQIEQDNKELKSKL